jgi:hypothetical protein
MRFIGFDRWRRWSTGALLLLLFHGLLMTRSAQAGCRSFVSGQFNRSSIVHHIDPLVTGESPTLTPSDSAHDSWTDETPRPFAPCSGPGCSSREPASQSSTIPDTDHTNRWVDLSPTAICPAATCWAPTIEEPTGRPTGRKPSIFHPPPSLPAARSNFRALGIR